MTQAGLSEDAALLAAIIESSDDAIVSKTLDGTILSWNTGAERLYGYSAEEMIGQPIATLAPPGREDEFPMIMERIAAGERVDHYKTARLAKDGRIVEVSVTISPIADATGAIVGASAVARDIGELREAERLRVESAARGMDDLYRLIIETAAEGIWAIDDKGLTTFVNQKLPEMLGYSAEEMLGRNPCDFVAEHNRPQAVESFLRLREGHRGRFEFVLERKDGIELFARVSGTPILDAAGKFTGGLAVVTDITDRELTERRLAAQHGVADALATSDSIDEATPKLLQAVGEAMGWRLAQVWTVDWKSGVLRFLVGWYADGVTQSAFERASREMTVRLGEGVLGRVWESNEPTWVTEVAEEPRMVRAPAAAADGLRTLLAFPIVFDGHVRAVVEFASPTRREVDEPVLEMVEAARRQIAQFWGRKLAEGALREAEERFRTLVEHLPLVTYVDRLDALISNIYTSPQVEPLLGYSTEEWQTNPRLFLEILHPDDRERVLSDHAGLTEEGDELKTEYRVFARDGRVVWIRDHAVVMKDEGGSPRYIQGCLLDITGRKQVENDLRTSETRLAEAQRIAHIGSWDWDISADKLFWSDEMKRIFGVDEEGFEGKYDTFLDHVHPEDRARIDAAVRNSYETGAPFTFEHRIVRPDGEERSIHAEGEVIFDDDGTPVRMAGVGQDVTDRKLAEARIAESEARFRAMYESAALGTVLIDLDRRILLTNHAFEELVGYSKDELLGMSFTDLTYPDDEPRSKQIMSILESGGLDLLEKRYVRKDGSLVWARVTSAPVINPDGELQSAIGIIENISERKLAEEQLREREQQYETLIDTARDAFVSIDEKSRIVAWNREAERLFGWTNEEVIGRRLTDTIMPPHYRRRHLKGLQSFLKTGQERVMDRTLELGALDRERNEFPIELTIWPTRHGGSWRFNSFIRDLRERRTLQEQLVHSQKMEAVGKLAGGVAHDFNNLLLAIRGYSELALDDLAQGDVDGRLEHSLEQIKEATKRAASLTSKLLMFSRKQVLNPRVVDLNELIAGLESLVQRITGVDVELVIALDPGPSPIRVDPSQMEQALMNIAINARDAMNGGGKLEFRTSRVALDKDEPHGQAIVPAGSYVQLAISDTGTGMDEETRSQVFDPFFTTKDLEKGTGLGLSTVYGFVKESKGFVFCESEPGRGTVFTLLLPVAGEPAVPPEDEEALRGPARGSETVLLAEDEDSVRDLLSVVLEREGYRVLAAGNGEEALALAEEHDGVIDVIVTDVVMPKLGGKLLADRLSAAHPGMQVIFMSGYTAEPDAIAEVDDAHFLQKPFAPRLLAGRVREALDGARRPS
jgi:two-component system, cell cycle sensor histidine kinase and response regulator CckA